MGRNSLVKLDSGSIFLVNRSELGQQVTHIALTGEDGVTVHMILDNNLLTEKFKTESVDKDIPEIRASADLPDCDHPLVNRDECRLFTVNGSQPILQIRMKGLQRVIKNKPLEIAVATIDKVLAHAQENVANALRA